MQTKSAVVFVAALFVTACCAAEETEPGAIFKKVLAAYDALETYSDAGKVVTDIDSGATKVQLTTPFTIKLKKPNLYLITWDQKNSGIAFTQAGTVWSDGTQPYIFMFMGPSKSYSKVQGDEVALGTATGISGGAAHTIPSLFLKHHGSPFARIKEPKLETSEAIDGDDCYVVGGSSEISKEEKYWISKESFLIRKYARSLETAEGGLKMPKITDEQLVASIKAMGEEPTEERKTAMREMMEKAQSTAKQMNLKGSSTETHSKITSSKLSAEDFNFKVPEGAVLKDSLFGGLMDAKKGK